MALLACAQVLFTLILAGTVAASPYYLTLNIGDTLPVQVITGLRRDVPCYLDTPYGETIEFRPGNNAPERIFYVETNVISYCGANITHLTENDEGIWKIYYIEDGKPISKVYHLTIAKDETSESESVEEEDKTEWLPEIKLITRTGLSVDISLSRKQLPASQEETFTITTPDKQTVQLKGANVPGLTVHSKSDFVASRVTVGPMDSSLIGRWILCGELDNGERVKRCQPVDINWYKNDNPSAKWDMRPLAKRDIVTNYEATIDTAVTSYGTVMTCHIITPHGEDLVLTTESTYPGLTFVPHQGPRACRVQIGPVHKEFLGDWTLYAIFNSVLDGVYEIEMPMHTFLYDENDPYAQAYNVTVLDPSTRVVNLGAKTTFEVTGSGSIESCELRSPTGQAFPLQHRAEPVTFLDTGSRIACAVSIGPFRKEILGDWEMVGKFSNRGIFTEIRQILHIIQEDPENPIMEDHRDVITRNTVFFNTDMDAEVTVVTDPDAFWFYQTESCHIRTPSGLQYTIMDGFNHPGVEIMEHDNNRCSVKIKVTSEELIGEWTLISREQRSSEAVELRQPFIIYVEENVDASTSQVKVTEGNDLHVRLAHPTNLHDSCKLFDPSGTERTDFEVDGGLVDTCGFIVRNLKSDDSGVWQIRYGTRISYKANINVAVKDQWEATHSTIVLTRGRSANERLGPETTIYCKLTDPGLRVIFEGYSKCNLTLERVTSDHAGTWVMDVGVFGSLLTRKYEITVVVRGPEDKAIVTTYVAKEQPQVTLKCSVPVEYDVRSCLFQEPSGRVIIANQGVAEDRYIFYGAGTTVNANGTTHECGLRIANPVTSDLGLWRCAVQTDHEVYYGFLTVLCPWAMQDPAVAAAVVSEPTLTARKENITVLEGDSLALSCSIQSPIHYCYFRRPNGMTYSVSPGISTDEYEYVGAGFDAGECGIRFSRLPSTEAGHWPEGRWSCHVGLPNATQPEQRSNIQVQTSRTIVVNQYLTERGLIVEANVFQQQGLEYCRYVRIDGLGFTSATLPDRYFSFENLNTGICRINIENPNILDMHPWTVAARVVGSDEEFLDVTSHTMETPTQTPKVYVNIWWGCLITLIGVIIISAGILLIPARNRKRTIARATIWRNSIRSSFTKAPLPADDVNRTTPMSA